MPPVAAVFLKKCFFLETNETNVGHIHFFSLAGDEAFFYIYIYVFLLYNELQGSDGKTVGFGMSADLS